MPHAYPELTGALAQMLDKIDTYLRDSGYEGPPVRMYLAGGLAVNYYCGSRYTEDVDASFSRRVVVRSEDLVIDYLRRDGTPSIIYFDANYNSTLSLLHEDFEDDALEWEGMNDTGRLVQLLVLSPLDLAVSKISRFTDQDQDDILDLARAGLITAEAVRMRALDALSYYVGNIRWVRGSIDVICNRIKALEATQPPRPSKGCEP